MLCAALPAPLTADERTPVPPIVLLTTSADYDPVRYEAGHMIADAWRTLGLSVAVEALPFRDLVHRVQNEQDFDAVIVGWSGRADRFDPQFFLGLLDSRQAGPGGNNFGGYANPGYDALFEAQARAFDPSVRRELVHAAQAIAARDVPVVILSHRDIVVSYATGKFGGFAAVPSDGLYTDWNMMRAVPLTERTRLRIGGHQHPDSFNPLASTTSWGWRWMRLYYDYLVRLTPRGAPQPWAARKIDVVDDAVLEVTLREGMTFHDGRPVTAADIAFSFTYPRTAGYSYFDAYLDALDTVEVVDDLTVRFTLKYPSAPFITTALSQIPILPRHLWAGIDNPSGLARQAVPVTGSGPFRVAPDGLSLHRSLDRFDDHFAFGDIAISGIDFHNYQDSDAVLAALLRGEIDITAGTLDAWHIPKVEAAIGADIMVAPDIGFNHLTFNLRRHVFGNTAFRRALTHAIDRDRVIDALLAGRAVAGASLIAPANRYWHNPDIEKLPFDMDAARAELRAAGFTWDKDGRLLMPPALGEN